MLSLHQKFIRIFNYVLCGKNVTKQILVYCTVCTVYDAVLRQHNSLLLQSSNVCHYAKLGTNARWFSQPWTEEVRNTQVVRVYNELLVYDTALKSHIQYRYFPQVLSVCVYVCERDTLLVQRKLKKNSVCKFGYLGDQTTHTISLCEVLAFFICRLCKFKPQYTKYFCGVIPNSQHVEQKHKLYST